jgi:hypothetical protein
MSLQQELGEQRGGFHFRRQFDQHAQGQRIVDYRLPNIEDSRAATPKNAGEGVRYA